MLEPHIKEVPARVWTLVAGEAGSRDDEDSQQRANQVWQDASNAVAKARGGR